MSEETPAIAAMTAMPAPRAFCTVEQLAFAYPGRAMLSGLSFTIAPGLSLIRGGDGRGKTTLLRLLAGSLQPTAGLLRREARTICHVIPQDPVHDRTVARAWLAARQAQFPAWREDRAGELAQGFGLGEHLDKPLFMLSTGSRRKLGLVAAAASAAQLTLLDTPFAALDARTAPGCWPTTRCRRAWPSSRWRARSSSATDRVLRRGSAPWRRSGSRRCARC